VRTRFSDWRAPVGDARSRRWRRLRSPLVKNSRASSLRQRLRPSAVAFSEGGSPAIHVFENGACGYMYCVRCAYRRDTR
jgi:hypothetical protein